MRNAIDPGHRLAITLCFLATGESYQSLEYNFRVAPNTIGKIVPNTREAIIHEFMEEVMSCPQSKEQWKVVAAEFANRWQFYNCLGALDGKHIKMKYLSNEGSVYFNYKGFHSLVLFALVDAGHKFLYVEIGANGRCSDGVVFRDTSLFKALEEGKAEIPDAVPLPSDTEPVHFHVVADDAFALRN